MAKGNTDRRKFIKKAATGIGLAGIAGGHQVIAATGKTGVETNKLPREVWVASVTSEGLEPESYQHNIDLLLNRMGEVAPFHPDIVCLTEVAPFMKLPKRPPLKDVAEEKTGPITSRFAEYARKNNCYVIIPLYTKEDGRYYNAAVLLDRKGNYVGEYRKMYLTTGEMKGGKTPGPTDPPVFKTDFGTIGIQICFDMQFFEGFRKLGEKGAEIVFWPSAYQGGKAINAMAWMNRYVIVSCSRDDPAKICDIDGSDIATSSYRFRHWICEPINLERTMVKYWPNGKKFEAMIKKYERKVKVKVINEEGWAIIESRSPEIKVDELLNEFGIDRFNERNEAAEEMYKTHRVHP